MFCTPRIRIWICNSVKHIKQQSFYRVLLLKENIDRLQDGAIIVRNW